MRVSSFVGIKKFLANRYNYRHFKNLKSKILFVTVYYQEILLSVKKDAFFPLSCQIIGTTISVPNSVFVN
jgi:hypothetical protein